VDGVTARAQKHIALILARELATQLATATFITDADGDLVFYNEAAEEILGRTFAEAGQISAAEWSSLYQMEELDGSPMQLERIPGWIALAERRPAHRRLCIVGLDGARRQLSATAMPLFSHPDEVVGMVAFFWESDGAVEDGR
jgi:PAS domain-containing protein